MGHTQATVLLRKQGLAGEWDDHKMYEDKRKLSQLTGCTQLESWDHGLKKGLCSLTSWSSQGHEQVSRK